MKASTTDTTTSLLTTTSPRLHYIDWLRVLAVLLLFPFHVSRVFNAGGAFYVKDEALSSLLTETLGFISVWHMQLLFFLAGASTYFALQRRGGGGYVLERVKRLLVPFLFGFLALIPPQTWLGARFNEGYPGSFWHYLASGDWLVWNIRDGGDYFGGFGLGHLWFIAVLFVLSVIALPLLLAGRTGWGGRLLARSASVLGHPAGWLLAVFAIFVGEALPELELRPFYYLVVFLLGYAVFAAPTFADSALRYRLPALVSGLGLSVFWVLSDSFRDSLPDPSFGRAGLAILGGAATWLTIVGLIGYGRRYLDRTSPSLSYLAEGSYPVYLLHQTVIVVLAFYLVAIPGPGFLRWALLLVGSVAATYGIYEIVRRLPVRVLFGLKRRRRRAAVMSAEPVTAAGSVVGPVATANGGPAAGLVKPV